MEPNFYTALRGYGANRTFFAYFSEFRSSNHILIPTIETVALVLVFLISLLTNACMMVLIVRGKRLINFQCLVLNLFLADIAFVAVIPIIIVVRWTGSWTLGAYTCRSLLYVMATSGEVAIITVAAISIERSISILNLRLKAPLHCKLVMAVILTIWLFSAITSLPLCIYFHVMTIQFKDQEYQICTLVWPNTVHEISWDVIYGLLIFIIPGLIIVISYTKILKITKATRKRLQASRLCSVYQQEIRVSRQDYWLFRTLLLLMISFFIMWAPVSLVIFLILAQNFKKDLLLTSTLFFWICTFTLTNSAVNPILYGATQFKGEWRQMLCFCHLKHRGTAAPECTVPKVRTQVSQAAPSVICN
ncbi:free fatty acid receptor 4-like [Hemiscyllium ocellatum]|uniref:free fatty acid receptor 4-like n=1 Tax=Hemiscyllium ocellatum TaxID=170820 RepID=UPI0029665C67|nr:free fatty acid receptor 4-like [Hemiscyllium ocellatum]